MRRLQAAAVVGAMALASAVFAQPYSVDWYVIGGGGGTSTGGSFSLSGTIGQPLVATSTGGSFTLQSGFWPGVQTTPPCAVDFNNDGILDNGDIGAFVQLFLAGDLAADTNNDNILDNGDIGVFVQLFLAGC